MVAGDTVRAVDFIMAIGKLENRTGGGNLRF